MSTGTRVDVESAGAPGVAILRVHGEITSGSEATLGDAYARATAAGAMTLVLDFAQLDYMNSGGIGLLVTLLVRVQRDGQRLMAVGLTDHYRQILSLTRLDEAIGIHPDEASALAAATA
jgi:anti-sigma B factor antagonist